MRHNSRTRVSNWKYGVLAKTGDIRDAPGFLLKNGVPSLSKLRNVPSGLSFPHPELAVPTFTKGVKVGQPRVSNWKYGDLRED